MEIVHKQDWNGVKLLVDGEDTETMSIQKREWLLHVVMEQIDTRHFETILAALAKEHGTLRFLDDENSIEWTFKLEKGLEVRE
jgi:hypothetical protein